MGRIREGRSTLLKHGDTVRAERLDTRLVFSRILCFYFCSSIRGDMDAMPIRSSQSRSLRKYSLPGRTAFLSSTSSSISIDFRSRLHSAPAVRALLAVIAPLLLRLSADPVCKLWLSGRSLRSAARTSSAQPCETETLDSRLAMTHQRAKKSRSPLKLAASTPTYRRAKSAR